MNPLWKIAHHFSNVCTWGGHIVSKIFWMLSCVIFANSVAAETQIGEGTIFYHHAIGCVTHANAKIGKNCKIFANVTLGAKWGGGERDEDSYALPVVGNNVVIGAGAVLLGKVTVGDNVVIGANAVVITDVPSDCYAVGVPAKIFARKQQVWR